MSKDFPHRLVVDVNAQQLETLRAFCEMAGVENVRSVPPYQKQGGEAGESVWVRGFSTAGRGAPVSGFPVSATLRRLIDSIDLSDLINDEEATPQPFPPF